MFGCEWLVIIVNCECPTPSQLDIMCSSLLNIQCPIPSQASSLGDISILSYFIETDLEGSVLFHNERLQHLY